MKKCYPCSLCADPTSKLIGGAANTLDLSDYLRHLLDSSTKEMRKAYAKTLRFHPTKEVSVMAWIEDSNQNILLVRQSTRLKLWTLPGGKVKRGESLVKALKREVYEETALHVQIGSLLGVLDRRDKDAITLLFAAVPHKRSAKLGQKQKDIKEVGFRPSLPKKASPSAKYFWSVRRGPVKRPPKIRAATHQFPDAPVIEQ